MTDNEFSVGPDWPLELTRDPVVRRNGGFCAHPSLGLEGSELSWAGQGLVDTGSLPSLQVLANTEDVAHGGTAPLILQPHSCLQVSDTWGGAWGLGEGKHWKL